MRFSAAFSIAITLVSVLFWHPAAQATTRWDVLTWCTGTTQEDKGRCEGVLYAAVDLRTSDDFSGAKSCFLPQTRLPQIREAVVAWLKANPVAPQQSGLALVARAIAEGFPCPD